MEKAIKRVSQSAALRLLIRFPWMSLPALARPNLFGVD